ncbi:MAG: hypothetical protein HOI03_09900 [Candidatus Marinimicrobia bacterium]|jgi:hypothetical protein|nr:hypothetical protein [Candidatus Neomarinimicrobiota bacterium]
MKSYFNGVLTGGLIVFTLMIALGSKNKKKENFSDTYRSRLIKLEDRLGMVEGSVNRRFMIVGENFLHLRNKVPISVSTEYSYNSLQLKNEPFPFEIK